MRTSGFRLALAAAALALVSTLAATGRALALDDIIAHAEPAVVHLAVFDATGTLVGTGSGFVVADNQIVTNQHVVERADRVEASFQDKKKVEVLGVSASDPAADIALLKLPPGSYSKLELADAPAKQGEAVVVIGSPMGFSGSVSTGIVAAVRPEGAEIDGVRQANWKLQLTAAIAPGSSGSPVLNENGDVVAVAVGVIAGRVPGQSLNFGVPASAVRTLYASRRKEPLPLAAGGRTRLQNLLISAVGLGAVALVALVITFVLRRRHANERNRGREVLSSILKR